MSHHDEYPDEIVVALYFGLWLFGFDNVMDRFGLTRPAIEQMRVTE